MKRILMTALFAVALTLSTFTGASAASFTGSATSGIIIGPEPAPAPNCFGQEIAFFARQGGPGRVAGGPEVRELQAFIREVICSGEFLEP